MPKIIKKETSNVVKKMEQLDLFRSYSRKYISNNHYKNCSAVSTKVNYIYNPGFSNFTKKIETK